MAHLLARPLPALALGAVLLSPATAQITKTGHGYSFRVKLSTGMVIKYTMAVTTSLSGMKVVFTNPIVQTVVGVRKGLADLVQKSGPLVVNGKPAGTPVVVQMTVDQRGKLSGEPTANSGFTAFPDKAIEPGASWKARVPLPTSGMTGSNNLVVTTYRFVRMTTYKGQRAAELAMSFNAGGQYKMDGSGTGYVLAKDGLLIHSAMKIHVAITANMEPATVNAEVNRS